MEMSLEVQLMNVQEQPSNIKREIRTAIEVNFNQLFLIRSGSWDQPRRYVPPERLRFYKQSINFWFLELTGASDLDPHLGRDVYLTLPLIAALTISL